MRRIGLMLLTLAAVGVCTPTVSSGQDSPGVSVPFLGGFLEESRIVYPLRVGEWRATGEHRYEQQESGVSVRYAHGEDKDRWIDLYFYPAGVIEDREFETMARQTLAQIVEIRIDRGAVDLSEGQLQPLSIASLEHSETAPVQGYVAELGYEEDGERHASVLTVLLDRLYFIKGRSTVLGSSASPAEVRGDMEQFLSRLMPRLTIISTGYCWQPLPIEQLEATEPAPRSFLSSSTGEGEPTEFLLGDRVLARDPDSAGARHLMMLGMAGLERLHPGCVGSEPINPEVADGMREIRIEYRPPAA